MHIYTYEELQELIPAIYDLAEFAKEYCYYKHMEKYMNTERSQLKLKKEYYNMTQTHTQQTLEYDIQLANLNAALQKKENQLYKSLVDSSEKDLEITELDLKIKYLKEQIKQAETKLSLMKK